MQIQLKEIFSKIYYDKIFKNQRQRENLENRRTRLSLTFVCVHAQLCLIPCNSMDCSLPDSSVHETFQARILEWVAISSPRGLKPSPMSPAFAARFFTTEPPPNHPNCIWFLNRNFKDPEILECYIQGAEKQKTKQSIKNT